MAKPSVQLNVRIDPALLWSAKRVATANRTNLTAIVAGALTAYVDDAADKANTTTTGEHTP